MTYRHMRLLSSMCFINVFTCVYSSDDPLTENLFNISQSDFFSPTCIVFLNYSYKYTYIYTLNPKDTKSPKTQTFMVATKYVEVWQSAF